MARHLTANEAARMRRLFPRANTTTSLVLAEANRQYNCLAWTLGVTNRWVWPWGGALPTDASMSAFLRQYGYRPGTPVAAATYGSGVGIQHIGRNGSWPTSKLGQWLLITHGWGELSGGAYGNLHRYYTRAAAGRALTDELGDELSQVEVEAGDPGEGLPELGEDLLQHLEALVAALPEPAVARFESAYVAWRDEHRIEGELDSRATTIHRSAAFVEARQAAEEAVPALIRQLLDPEEWRALRIADEVLPASSRIHFDLDDPIVLEGEQFRARVTAMTWLQR